MRSLSFFVVALFMATPAQAQFFRSSGSCPNGQCGASSYSSSFGYSSYGYSSPMLAAPPLVVAQPGVVGVGSYYLAPGPAIYSSPWAPTRSHGVVRWKIRERW